MPRDSGRTIEVSFSLRPEVPFYQMLDVALFESRSSTVSIHLAKETQGFSNLLTLSVADNKGALSVISLPLSPSTPKMWHTLKLNFDNRRAVLTLSFDGRVKEAPLRSSVNLGERISFGGFEGAIDNVVVNIDEKPVLKDDF